MARLRTIKEVQTALFKHFIPAWEAVRPAPAGYVLGNEKPPFETGQVTWARFSAQYASNNNLFVSGGGKQRQGLIRVEIHVPQDTSLNRIADLEDVIVALYEGDGPDNIRFFNPFPIREGVLDADYQTTITIGFRIVI